MSDRLDIVIVNWNAGAQLRDCLASFPPPGLDSPLGQVIVVDNGSTDDSLDGLEAFPHPLRVLRLGENRGFAAAVNAGARESTAPFLLLLNPDMTLRPDSLTAALAHMTAPENAEVGVLGIALEDETGQVARSCAREATPTRFWAMLLGLHRLFPARGLGVIMTDWDHGETRDVDHVIGAFYLVRRTLFQALGGLDERFFVYLEDLDFSHRARRAGWTLRYLATATAFHKGGGTSSQALGFRLFLSLQSRMIYAFKHFGRTAAVLHLLGTLTLEPLARAVLALAARRPGDLCQLAWVYGRLVGAVPRIWASRRL